MSSLLIQLVRLAKITWDPRNAGALGSNVQQLKQLVDRITAQDLQLSPGLLHNSSVSPQQTPEQLRNPSTDHSSSPSSATVSPILSPARRVAPCTYLSIVDEPNVTISVFILNESESELPLHDHPGMHGLVKAISGQLLVQGYTALDDNNGTLSNQAGTQPRMSGIVPVRREEPIVIGEHSPALMLTPSFANYHHIRPVSGRAAFVDILSPPYHTEIPELGKRKCTYYQPVQDGDEYVLMPTDCPSSYWCNEVAFEWSDRADADRLD